MRPQLWISTCLVCLVVFQLAACSREAPAVERLRALQASSELLPTAQERSTSRSTRERAPRITTGQLRSVDVQAKSFTIQDATGNEQAFSYTDSTDIAGSSGAQGLSGRQGSQLLVHYVRQDAGNAAVRIQIVPR